MSITPNADQFMAYAQSDHTGEVVMLNLLQFKEKSEDGEGGTGQDAYNRYGDQVVKMIEASGGRLLWLGKPIGVFIGDVDENEWDAVALVSYPSRDAFIQMVSTPEYNDAHEHREGGLADTVVIACAPAAAFQTN